ncbi:MAG: hypothetical protein CMP22_00910 [Rickettsiales bacterium]|nr:hypothetical protein [Rickettsiales bacterium]
MTLARNLMVAAVMTLTISACSTYSNCDYYPREHYEAWQEDCSEMSATSETRVERTRVRSFNRSMDK